MNSRRNWGRYALLALGLVLAGEAGAGIELPDASAAAADASATTGSAATASGPATAGTAPAPAATSDSLAMPASAAELFHQKKANGLQLAFVLQGLSSAAQQRTSRTFFEQPAPVDSSADPSGVVALLQKASHAAYSEVASKIADLGDGHSYSDRSLKHFLDGILKNEQGLLSHTVELPKEGEKMTSAQQERLLILGAMVIGAQLAKETLNQAQENFKIIAAQYEKVLEHRRKAAELLAGVMLRRSEALAAKNELEVRNIVNGLSDDDLKFIDSFGAGTNIETFADDVGLQNLALAYLRKTDPKSYEEYVAEQKEFVSSGKAYLQTVGGVAAFGGFTVLFGKQLVEMVHAKDYSGGFASLNLIRDFVKEARPLIKSSTDALYVGLVTAPKDARRTYRIEHAGVLTDIDHAPQVFKALNSAGDKALFDDALFRDGVPGFVSHVYQCDPEHAGGLIDSAVPATQRREFAQDYLNWSQQGVFSFADALYDELKAPGGRTLAEPLLNRDQRKRAETVSIGVIQNQTMAKDESWDDVQLMRMILANSQGTRAQMQLGSSIVRLVPSMATIYAYESYTETCIKTASPEPAKVEASKPEGAKSETRNKSHKAH